MSYILCCESCSFYKKYSEDELKNLIENKISLIPGGMPSLVGKDTINKKAKKRPRQFKCPSCGRSIAIKERMNDEQKNDNNGRETSPT